jgi:hypothetical protein
MSITEAIALLKAYIGPAELTLHKGADEASLQAVEDTYGITLPADFKELYRFSDGFETVEDIFNMIPLAEIIDNRGRNKRDAVYIAEYMTYADMWELEIEPNDCNDYKIVCLQYEGYKLTLTHSLAKFIGRFLKGHVFDFGGLYAWADEIKAKLYGNTDPLKIKPLLWVFRECLKLGLTTKQRIVHWADWIIATEEKPHHFFIEMSRSRDLDELIAVLGSMHITENILQVRAIFSEIHIKLIIDKIENDDVISILSNFLHDERFTAYERNKIMKFIVDSKDLNSKKPKAKLKQRFHDQLKEFFDNYHHFNMYYPQNWEKVNADLVTKFESMDK